MNTLTKKNKGNANLYLLLGFILIGIFIAVLAYFYIPKNNEYAVIKNENMENNTDSDNGRENIGGETNLIQPKENGDKKTIAVIKTNFGDIKLELFTKDAPKTAENFIKLSESKFYNETKFHRIIKDFMIQGGDPNSKDDDWANDGTGGPGYKFNDEINSNKIVRGTLAMANSGPNTNGSQFFIVTATETPWLDGKHTVFGKVTEGMDTVLKIENVKTNGEPQNHPIQNVIIEKIEILN